jgi:hypothetical protein
MGRIRTHLATVQDGVTSMATVKEIWVSLARHDRTFDSVFNSRAIEVESIK